MTLLSPPAPPSGSEKAPPAAPPLVPWHWLLWPLFGVCVVLGAVGMYMRITNGHLDAGYGSYVPWGLWIAIYFHAVGIAAGAFAVTAAGYLLGAPGFRSRFAVRVAAVVVAASVGPALLAVGLDLGHMGRSYRILTAPSFTSMMAFNSWTYVALLLTAGVVWYLSFRPDSGWLKPFLVLAIVLSVMVPSQSGAFLGVVDARPYWNSALLPPLMLVSSLTAGAGVLMLVRALLGDRAIAGIRDSRAHAGDAVRVLRAVIAVGILTYFLLEFAELSLALWDSDGRSPEIDLLLTGSYWWVFWGVHVVLGGVVPLALLATRRPVLWVAAGAVTAFAFLATRLDILIPGQAVAEIEGLQEAYAHPRLSFAYNATLMEYLVGLFVFALGMALLWTGLRVSAAMSARASGKERSDVAR